MATDLIARGMTAKALATRPFITFEEFGATGMAGTNDQPAIQAAIDYAVANGVPRVVGISVAYELWEPAIPGPDTAAWDFHDYRTLSLPACEALDIDFGGARITIKGPDGAGRYPGQTIVEAGLGTRWLGGFITVAGVVGWLRIANVDVEGGFTGNSVEQPDVNLLDKGFMWQDLGDAALGEGNGSGT